MKRSLAAMATLICAATLLPSSIATAKSAAPETGPTAASARPPETRRAPRPPADPDRVRDPDRRLGTAWRRSADRAVTTSGEIPRAL